MSKTRIEEIKKELESMISIEESQGALDIQFLLQEIDRLNGKVELAKDLVTKLSENFRIDNCRCIDMNAGVSSGPKQCYNCDMVDNWIKELELE